MTLAHPYYLSRKVPFVDCPCNHPSYKGKAHQPCVNSIWFSRHQDQEIQRTKSHRTSHRRIT
jgi:hypothetical protein